LLADVRAAVVDRLFRVVWRFDMRWYQSVGVLLGAALLTGGEAHGDEPGKKVPVVVTARGFRSTKGQALVALYSSKDGWLKLDRAVKVIKAKIDGDKLTVTLPEISTGVYAVSVTHDENSNGKLDMRWFPFPWPDEGAGVSNDATATIGPPSYNDARFTLGDNGANISLKIRY
jgi:uncharacterized protein (DUF2141 family)